MGGLAVGAAIVSLYFALAGRAPKIDLETYHVLGVVAAEETAKLLGNKGQVLVMARDAGSEVNPSVEAQLRAFRQTLKPHSGLSVVTDRIRATPMQMMATGGAVPADQLIRALATHKKVGALVLFCAFPPLPDSELSALKQRGTRTVVVSSFHPDYRRLLQQQAIHLVIVPRPERRPPGGQPARTARERFAEDFLILTPADVARSP